MEIEWSLAAERQLEAIIGYLFETAGLRAAEKLADHIDNDLRRLLSFPQIAPMEPLLDKEAKAYRSLVVRHNYKIVYSVENEIIYIDNIWDCRQNPKKLKKGITGKK